MALNKANSESSYNEIEKTVAIATEHALRELFNQQEFFSWL
jgi:hypothetical protein